MAVKKSIIIYKDMNEKILSGKYKENSRLPTERELSEYYKTSRIPIREALKILEKENLVEIKPGIGTFVKENKIDPKLDGNSIEKSDFHIKFKKMLLETMKIRSIIELESVVETSKYITKEEMSIIEVSLIETIKEIRKMNMREKNNFFEKDFEFHKNIVKFSHNAVYLNIFEQMKNIINEHQDYSLGRASQVDDVITYHTAVYEQIIKKNPMGAKAAMKKHLNKINESIEN